MWCIMKVIQFVKYINFQLRRLTEQLFMQMCVFLCTLSRINCIAHRRTEECCDKWDLFIVRELSMLFREIPHAIQAPVHCRVQQWRVTKLYTLWSTTFMYLFKVYFYILFRCLVPFRVLCHPIHVRENITITVL